MSDTTAENLTTDDKPVVPARMLYPSDEARALLGDISESTFRRLTKSGRLPARKIKARVYVTDADLRDYIDSLETVKTA